MTTTTAAPTFTFQVMTVVNGISATRSLPDKPVHEAINEIVGGWFCIAFDVIGPQARMLTGYVHDEGLLLQLPFNVAITYPNGYANTALVGPMVIMATDAAGESQPLSDVEIAWLHARQSPAVVRGWKGEPVQILHFDFTK